MPAGYGMKHPYREYSEVCGYIIAHSKEFVVHCENVSKAETGKAEGYVRISLQKMEIALKALESALYRGDSPYDIRTAVDVRKLLVEQFERLHNHMPGRYIREDDPVRKRYEEGALALQEMETLHNLATDTNRMAIEYRGMPLPMRAVLVEMCWHILDIRETGAEIIGETWKESRRARRWEA